MLAKGRRYEMRCPVSGIAGCGVKPFVAFGGFEHVEGFALLRFLDASLFHVV
jgi:hypothetical protein